MQSWIRAMSRGALLLATAAALYAAPTAQTAVAETVIGRVEVSQSGGKWKAVKTGTKIRQQNQIRTFAGAQADLRLPDGSQLSLQENSILDMSELMEESGHLKNSVEVKKGKVLFSIKKLTTAQSSFEFKTTTATAAIRGTEGGIAVLPSGLVAFLQSGRMELKDLSGNQFALLAANTIASQTGEGFDLYRLPDNFDVADLMLRLSEEGLLQLLGQLQGIPVGAWIIEQPAPGSEVSGPFVLTGFGIPGTTVDAGEGSAVADNDGNWSISLPARSAPGPFVLRLKLGGDQGSVLEWPLVAVEPETEGGARGEIELETPTTVRIDNGVLQVAGKVPPGEGRLTLRIGAETVTVPVVDGAFDASFAVSDAARNWDATSAQLRWEGSVARTEIEIGLEIDKTAKGVNTLSPDPQMEVLNGQLRVGVHRMEGDQGVLRVLADGSEIDYIDLRGNLSGRTVPMLNGVHDYEVVAVDQAGNRGEKKLIAREHWSRVILRVEVTSPTRSRGLRVPPLPPGVDQQQTEPVSIRIYNLPDDDPRALKEIEVTNPATNFRKVLTGTQLDDIRYDLDVPIRRSGINRITVKAEPKNGMAVVGQKTIELGR